MILCLFLFHDDKSLVEPGVSCFLVMTNCFLGPSRISIFTGPIYPVYKSKKGFRVLITYYFDFSISRPIGFLPNLTKSEFPRFYRILVVCISEFSFKHRYHRLKMVTQK